MSSSISFRISDELKEKLEVRALATGQSLSDLAKGMIERCLGDADSDAKSAYEKLFNDTYHLLSLVLKCNAGRHLAREVGLDELREYCEGRLRQMLPKLEAEISKMFLCQNCGTEIETVDGQRPEYCPECEAEITAPGEPRDDFGI